MVNRFNNPLDLNFFDAASRTRISHTFENPAHFIIIERAGGLSSSEERFIVDSFFSAGQDSQGPTNFQNINYVRPTAGKKFVAVEELRALISQLSLSSKSLSNSTNKLEKRLIIFNQDVRLDARLQNTLLKILEEPLPGVYFLIFYSTKSGQLLPTIRSRSQSLSLAAPSQGSVIALLAANSNLNQEQATLLLQQSGNSALELELILSDEAAKERSLQRLSSAKDIVRAYFQKDAYQVLKIIKNYSSKREDLESLLQSLLLVIELVVAASPGQAANLANLLNKVELSLKNLKASANLKIQTLVLAT